VVKNKKNMKKMVSQHRVTILCS